MSPNGFLHINIHEFAEEFTSSLCKIIRKNVGADESFLFWLWNLLHKPILQCKSKGKGCQ